MDTSQEWKKGVTKIALLLLTLPVVFAGLNVQQLSSAWTVWSDIGRDLARERP